MSPPRARVKLTRGPNEWMNLELTNRSALLIMVSQSATCFRSSISGFGGKKVDLVLLVALSSVLGPTDRIHRAHHVWPVPIAKSLVGEIYFEEFGVV